MNTIETNTRIRMRGFTVRAAAGAVMAIGALSVGCGEMDETDETIVSAVGVNEPIAFQADDHYMLISTYANNSSIAMASGTVPSQVNIPTSNNGILIGLQRSDQRWVTDQFQDGTHTVKVTAGLIQAGTSPSLALCATCTTPAFSFHGIAGNFWLGWGDAGQLKDTGGTMKSGSSPSIGMLKDGRVAWAFQGVNGHLWAGTTQTPSGGGYSSIDTNGVMAGSTSPAMAVGGPNDRQVIAFQGYNGHLWVGNAPKSCTDTGFTMRAGTSPSAIVRPDGTGVVAFQSNTGNLYYLTNPVSGPNTVTNTGLAMNATASPQVKIGRWETVQIVFKHSVGKFSVAYLDGTYEISAWLMN